MAQNTFVNPYVVGRNREILAIIRSEQYQGYIEALPEAGTKVDIVLLDTARLQ